VTGVEIDKDVKCAKLATRWDLCKVGSGIEELFACFQASLGVPTFVVGGDRLGHTEANDRQERKEEGKEEDGHRHELHSLRATGGTNQSDEKQH